MNIECFKVIYHYCDNTLQYSDIDKLQQSEEIIQVPGYFSDKILCIGYVRDQSIRDILIRLKETCIYFEDGGIEDLKLREYFGESYKQNWGVIDASEYNTIHFLEVQLSNNDTIYKLKRILSYYLSKIYNISFSPLVQTIWAEFLETPLLLTKWNIFCNQYYDIFVPIDINILKMYAIINDYSRYKSDDKFIEICEKSIMESKSLQQSSEIKQLFMNPEKYKFLGHSYYYKRFNINIGQPPLFNMEIDNRFIHGNIDSIKDMLLETKESSDTIYNFGKLKRNELHLQNILNIHRYIENNHVMKTRINLDQPAKKQEYVQGFIRKYCPSILNYEMLTTLLSDSVADTIQLYEKPTLFYENIRAMYQHVLQEIKLNLMDTDKTITIDSYPIQFNFGGIYQLFIQIPLENQYQFLDINYNMLFNNIQLHKKIPFISIWNTDHKLYYYKLYKPSIEKTYQSHYSNITSDILINWLENNKKTMHGLKVGIEKNISKHILMKAYIDTAVDLTIRHLVEIISYTESDIDVKYMETNMIEYGVLHKCMVTKADELIEGNQIYIYKHTDIYADLIINKDGLLDISIDYLIPNILELDRINIIFERLRNHITFINDIPNIFNSPNQQYMLPTAKIEIDKIIPYYNHTFSVKQLSYYMSIDVSDDTVISYDYFLQFIKCFYPMYTIMDVIFQEGQKIEINIEGSWKDGVIDSVIIQGRSINYDVKYYPNRGMLHTVLKKKVFNIQIRKKIDRLTREFIHLKYKLIDQFELSSPITTMIQKYHVTNHDSHFIISQLMKHFDLELPIAKEKFNIYKERRRVHKMIGNSIDIRIYLNKINKSKMGYSIPVIIENSYDFYQLNQIKQELVALFTLYQDIVVSKKSDVYKRLFSFHIDTCEIEKEKIQLEDNLDDLMDQFNDSESDSESDSDSILSTDSENDEEAVVELVADALQQVTEPNQLDTELDLLISSSQVTMDTNNIFLKKMYSTDPYLFWKTVKPSKQDSDLLSNGKSDAVYTKICQGGRQPMIMTDEQKLYIDQQFPDSYSGGVKVKATMQNIDKSCKLDQNVSCRKENLQKDKCCNALYHGSTDEQRVWYICPRIWCVKDEVSLHPDQLKMSKPLLIDGKIVCHKFKSNWKSTEEWSTCITCNNDIRLHPITCPVCDRAILNSKSNTNESTETESIYITSKNFHYPGFLESSKHPDGLFAPCCFKTPNKRVNESFGYGVDKSTTPDNLYIQNWGKELGWNPVRLGVLPKMLYSLFKMDLSTCIAQHMSNDTKCYLRNGVYQSSNSIIEAIANTLPSKYFLNDRSSKLKANYIIDLIVNNITKSEYNNLYSGLLDRIFMDNHPEISSYQNFLEHILSNEEKDYKLIMNICTSGFSWLPVEFKYGLNIILIEITLNEKNEEVASIIAPSLFKMEGIENRGANNIIILKYKKIFEPIYYFNSSIDNVTRLFKQSTNATIHECLDYIRTKYRTTHTTILNNIMTVHESTIEFSKINDYIDLHYSRSYYVDYQIKNTYNKTIGFIYTNLHEKIYVPCKPIIPIEHIRIIPLLELDVTMLSSYDVYLKFYKKMGNHLGFTIQKKVISSNVVIGFLTDDDQFIIVNPTAQSELIELQEDTIHQLDIEKAIDTYKKTQKLEYAKKNKVTSVISLLDRMNKKNEIIHPGSNIYKIKYKLLTASDNIVGLVTNDMLFIPVEEISNNSTFNYDVIEYNDIPKLDVKTLINKYIKVFKDSVMRFRIRPMRMIMDDNKNITHLLLETNDKLPVLEGDSLLTTDQSGQYLIHLINNIEYNFIPEEIIISKYERLHGDKRIHTIQQITYETEFYIRYKFEIGNYMRFHPVLKKEIKNIINNLTLTTNMKRDQLKEIIEKISSKIISSQSKKDVMDFDLSYIPTILCGNLHKNQDTCTKNPYCTWVYNKPTVGIRKIPDPFKLFKNDNRKILLSQFTRQTLQLKLTELKINSSRSFNKNIELLLLYMWRKLDIPAKELYKDKVRQQIDANKTKMPPTGSNSCKLYLHKYKEYGLTYFIRKIIEELIHNNIVYNEIIYNKITIDYGNGKYKKQQNEVLLNSDQLNRIVINDLYKVHQKIYNRNMNLYQYPDEIIDMVMPASSIMLPTTCELYPKTVPINYSITGLKRAEFQSTNENCIYYMTKQLYSNWMLYFNNQNTEIDSKKVIGYKDVKFTILIGKKILQLHI